MRRQIGVDNLMFGIDYPHLEGTYPLTKEWLQGTFGAANASVSDTEKILGENAIRVYGFDETVLRAVAAKVGFATEEVLVETELDLDDRRLWHLRRPACGLFAAQG